MPARTDPKERAKMMEDRKKRLGQRMAQIRHKLIVLSGKGGVGKSTVSAFVASALASRGNKVGLLDTDIHGPSIPKILGIEDKRISVVGDSVMPVNVSENLRVMSIAFLLKAKSDAVIWRGPLKMGMIEEFLANVEWGQLDYLIIDSPPGTGDEPLSVCQLVPGLDGAIVVATPQDVALADVEKSIVFCGQVRTRVIGVVENMSGFVCPHCGKAVNIFKTGGAEKLARDMGVPFLGRIPMVPEVVEACDEGRCNIEGLETDSLKGPLEDMASRIVELTETGSGPGTGRLGASRAAPERPAEPVAAKETVPVATASQEVPAQTDPGVGGGDTMKIALPVENGSISSHFGHSPHFGIFEVSGKEIVSEDYVQPPAHSPGVLPAWLMEQGVKVVLASGLGRRAIGRFEEAGIEIVYGVPVGPARDVVTAYLSGTLKAGDNVCDH
jgi:Mrp family chromosome partitioning ATPase/predicted Fe-Mo cluster-binding NifX family protein